MLTKKTQWSNDIQAFTARVGDSNPHGFRASMKTADWKDLDRLKEARDIATIQLAKHLQGSHHHHGRNVRGRAFSTGDLVLRKVQKRKHKLSAIWEGPYIISEMTRPRLISSKTEMERQSTLTIRGT